MAQAVRFEVVPRRAASAFDRLPEVARDILRLCDGHRTLAAIRASSPIAPAGTERVLERLASLGLIAARPVARPVRKPLTKSASSWIESGPPIPLAKAQPPAPMIEPPPPSAIVVPLVQAEPEPAPEPALTPEPAPALRFSDDEEAFFSSSIDHLIEA